MIHPTLIKFSQSICTLHAANIEKLTKTLTNTKNKKNHPDNMTQNIFPIKINLRTPTHITKSMGKKIQLKQGEYPNQLSVIVHQIKYRVGSVKLRLECI